MTCRIEFTLQCLKDLAALRAWLFTSGCSPRNTLLLRSYPPSQAGLTWPDRDFHPAKLAPSQAHEHVRQGSRCEITVRL